MIAAKALLQGGGIDRAEADGVTANALGDRDGTPAHRLAGVAGEVLAFHVVQVDMFSKCSDPPVKKVEVPMLNRWSAIQLP